MRYTPQQQALLKRAFDCVARALAESPVMSRSGLQNASAPALIVAPTRPRTATAFFSALPYDAAVATTPAEQPAQDAADPLHAPTAPTVITASVLYQTTAGHFFAQLPYEPEQYQAVAKSRSQQSQQLQPKQPAAQQLHAQPTAVPATASKRPAVGEWFSQINWQGSTSPTNFDTDAQSFARMATSTALNSASRAVGTSQH